jgi:ferredoxin
MCGGKYLIKRSFQTATFGVQSRLTLAGWAHRLSPFDRLLINPDTCIDCDACVPECPVEAIYSEDNVPDDQQEWIDLNKDAENHPTLEASKDPLKGPKCGNPNAA